MKKSGAGGIWLSHEKKKQMETEIICFFQVVRDEKIGIIAAQEILEFFLEKLGKEVYNQALDDVQIWQRQVMENMELDYYSLYKK